MMAWLLVPLALAALWFSFRYAWWRPAVSDRYPRILMYHMVCDHRPGRKFNGLRVPPQRFERQLRWLREHGWQSYTMSELVQAGDRLPPRAVALTFDDGFADNCLQALPLLEKYRMKATLYLVVDRHDRDWSVDKKAHHDSGELQSEPKLTDEQVRLMLASGLVELGSHTVTHPNFLRLGNGEREAELRDSKRELESRFGVAVNAFAYPFGLFRDEDPGLVRAAGYTSAVTTEAGIETDLAKRLFTLRRVKVSGKDNLLAFAMRMRGGRRGWNK